VAKAARFGQVVAVPGDLDITLTGVTFNSNWQLGTVFAETHWKVHNPGNGDVTLVTSVGASLLGKSDDFQIVSRGTLSDPAATILDMNRLIGSPTIVPGGTVRGDIVFRVVKRQPATVQYQPSSSAGISGSPTYYFAIPKSR